MGGRQRARHRVHLRRLPPPYFPSFAADLPYNVVQVQLDEGPRLTANLVNVPNAEITIGMRVEVVFDDVTPEVSLPRFRRATT